MNKPSLMPPRLLAPGHALQHGQMRRDTPPEWIVRSRLPYNVRLGCETVANGPHPHRFVLTVDPDEATARERDEGEAVAKGHAPQAGKLERNHLRGLCRRVEGQQYEECEKSCDDPAPTHGLISLEHEVARLVDTP